MTSENTLSIVEIIEAMADEVPDDFVMYANELHKAAAVIKELVEALEPFAKFNISGFDGPVMEVVPPWAGNPAKRIESIFKEDFVRAGAAIAKVRT